MSVSMNAVSAMIVGEAAAKLNAYDNRRVGLCCASVSSLGESRSMIVSHKNRFIFIKTNKTAGTSIEIALSKFCGPDDIITPVSPDDESIRRSLGYPGPQNHLAPTSEYGVADHFKRLLGKKKLRLLQPHLGARGEAASSATQIWNSYFKFCFERHPFDRVISLYYWRHKREPRPSISDFLDSDVPNLLRKRGYDLYTIDCIAAVDRVCLYENMAQELEQLRERFGFDAPLELPHAKGSHRVDRRNPRDILSERDKERIRRMFATEIEQFGFDV